MPSLNNENESDGDGEMSDNESQHSNSSRDAKADSSEADEPDSDSSELDEPECERRTAGFVKYMSKKHHKRYLDETKSRSFRLVGSGALATFAGDLENQFSILREQLYQERIKQNELHLNDVRNGRSQEYVEPLKQLTETMQSRIEVAGVLKRLRMENIDHKFRAEEQAASQHFEVNIIKNDYFQLKSC